jgi:hypothetical protein
MASFWDLFEPGHLVYGRWDVRENYINELKKNAPEKYNALQMGVGEDVTQVGKRWTMDQINDWSRLTTWGRQSTTGYAQRFFRSRFSTEDEDLPDPNQRGNKEVRRFCKYGIDYVATIGHLDGMKVHFALDGIHTGALLVGVMSTATKIPLQNLLNHVKNPPQDNRPYERTITNTELLSVYRNWSYYKPHIYFYKDCVCVPAPWENDTAPPERLGWKAYAKTRYDKYLRQFGEARGRELGTARRYKYELERLDQAQMREANAQQYDSATEILKEALLVLGASPSRAAGSLFPERQRTVPPIPDEAGLSRRTLKQHVTTAIQNYKGASFQVFRSPSTEAEAAVNELDAQVEHLQLLASVRFYLGLIDRPGHLPHNAARLKAEGNSRFHRELLAEYKKWRFGN